MSYIFLYILYALWWYFDFLVILVIICLFFSIFCFHMVHIFQGRNNRPV
jgi:hypothetical protein